MRREINDDNLYKEGTIVFAKVAPELKLVIRKYRQRIYYCAELEHPDQNDYAYFEKELVPTVESDQVQFTPLKELVGADKNYVFRKTTDTL